MFIKSVHYKCVRLFDTVNIQSTKWTWLWGEYENFTGTRYADDVRGNLLNNYLNGGGGDDYLFGGEGNDVFDWDSNLRDGNDTFEGGLGDDVYVLNSIYDTVIEQAYEGVDTIYIGVSYSLESRAIENLRAFSNQAAALLSRAMIGQILLRAGRVLIAF